MRKLTTPTISRHEVQVLRELLVATEWLSATDIAERAGIAARTARAHAGKLVSLGIAEQAAVFPGYRYRVVAHPCGDYLDQLRNAATALGIKLPEGDRR